METAVITLFLILGPSLTQACTLLSVTQKPPYLASMAGDLVIIKCDITIMAGTSQKLTSFLYRAEHPKEPQNTLSLEPENRTVTHNHSVTGSPGVYYCRVSCGDCSINGEGTYVYARDYFYVAPSSAADKLCSALIVLFILLLLLAGSGSYLILPVFWKREDRSPAQTRGQISVVSEPPSSRPVVEDAGSSLYTSLEPRSEEVYDVLEDDTKTKELGGPKKHQVEIHKVASRSPVRRARVQEKASSFQEKPTIKPKPKKTISESNVYENLRL
ncbi:NFAT activation molecule 1 isoform X1 [Ranitomeya variabilis]|uniref:NFAT activation molecule 1 isoform X1 n=1 Tax=Ranitomeya variabilis TaxID=490064 RepID=UPI0040577311